MSDPLMNRARTAAARAYAPYSGFSVGCAVESIDGEVVVGANMENACYRLGVCAEIAALTAAQQAFGLARIARIAIVGGRYLEGRLIGTDVCRPCGACRQAILEAGSLARRDILVQSSNGDGDKIVEEPICALLPHAFGPASLA